MIMRKFYAIGTTRPLAIRLLRRGCANRPFYHIIVTHPDKLCMEDGIEQLGVYDPMPNENNERLISLNIDRFKQYVAEGAEIRVSAAMLLGTAGVLPIHPHLLTLAWRQRQHKIKKEQENSTEKVEVQA